MALHGEVGGPAPWGRPLWIRRRRAAAQPGPMENAYPLRRWRFLEGRECNHALRNSRPVARAMGGWGGLSSFGSLWRPTAITVGEGEPPRRSASTPTLQCGVYSCDRG